ncbi:hypothetical protein GO003_018940 [Methylicorpusculum oleiharenae]|uniref:hypothetical protein n=1 Tax=Methylicorpusculum oleiharenae TaxID=1338687 RepID=UPI001356E661|nr:hypothetical protein [Methylicorpusculum oleiharenae]MCD2452464.1 hypothetical protein [Methylicorpusculum oleiharenae]
MRHVANDAVVRLFAAWLKLFSVSGYQPSSNRSPTLLERPDSLVKLDFANRDQWTLSDWRDYATHLEHRRYQPGSRHLPSGNGFSTLLCRDASKKSKRGRKPSIELNAAIDDYISQIHALQCRSLEKLSDKKAIRLIDKALGGRPALLAHLSLRTFQNHLTIKRNQGKKPC